MFDFWFVMPDLTWVGGRVSAAVANRPLRAMARNGAELLDAPLTVFDAPDAYRAVYRQAPGTRFAAQAIFPEHFAQIIRVGEKSAKLDLVISNLAQSLEEESEAGISQLTQFLEPLLIIILGGLVAIILIAMYLPMFELSTAIS